MNQQDQMTSASEQTIASKEVLSTTINRDYAVRFLGVAILFMALAGWFLYDGKIGYPQENERVAPVAMALSAQPLAAADWMNTAKTGRAPLVEAFEKAGLTLPSKYRDTFQSWISAGDPRATEIEAAQMVLQQPVHREEDIRAQFVSAGIGLLAAFGLLGLLSIRLLTRFELSENTLTLFFGKKRQDFALDSLQKVDTTQWEKRGILKVTFASGSVTLDAWHHAGIRPIAEKLIVKKA